MNINFNIDSTDDVVTAITMLNYLLDGMKQKTERAIEKSEQTVEKSEQTVEKSKQTVEKSESTPEFETSADSNENPVENGEVTPDMMIKFITEKLKSMAKNGNKETAKQFMRDHKLPNVSALSSLAISRLETVYHDVAKI
jgi:hypothetical protein